VRVLTEESEGFDRKISLSETENPIENKGFFIVTLFSIYILYISYTHKYVCFKKRGILRTGGDNLFDQCLASSDSMRGESISNP
jgi:hypothetical protein